MHTTGSTLSTAKVRARRLCFLASGSPLNRCPSKCQGAGYLKHPDAAYTFAFSRSSLLFWHYSCGSFHRSPFLNFFLLSIVNLHFWMIIICHVITGVITISQVKSVSFLQNKFVHWDLVQACFVGRADPCLVASQVSPGDTLGDPMAEVAESWEDLCPKKKGRKPKKSHSKCKKMDCVFCCCLLFNMKDIYINSQDCLQDVYDRSCWRMYINGRNFF